jgi:hypothetical protein
MVIEAVAMSAMAILKMLLGKTGEGFAKKVGEQLAEKAGELYQSVKQKFSSDPYALQTLTRAEENPASADRIVALEGVLKEKLGDDPEFAKQVERLVQEAKTADANRVLVIGDRNVAVGGNATGTFVTGDFNQVNKEK